MSEAAAPPSPTVRWLPVALLASAVFVVFHGALGLYFAQEDFRGLAVAGGIVPRHAQLWRYLSVQAYMDVVHPLFRDRAWPYHATSLALHALNAGLLFTILSHASRRAVAFLAATFFATHPALFTALYWQSARADLLAATFALLTVIVALRRGSERWLAVPAFAACLMSKESMLLLPAVTLLLDRRFGAPKERSPGHHVALFGMSAAYLLYLVRARGAGITGPDPGAAYALDLGLPLVANLLTYVGWTVDLAMLRPGLRFVDARNPDLFPLAVLVIAGCALLASWPALRRRGWLTGLATYVLLLAPVLPLRNHTYHYYLYGPLLAAALVLCVLADALAGRMNQVRASAGRGAARTGAWALAALCWVLLTWNGARLVRAMEQRPSPAYPGLRGDPIVDRSLIAERAIRTLRSADLPEGTELRFIMRERIALIARVVRGSGEEMPPQEELYPEANFRVALHDGLGVLALVPAVESVSFALHLGQPAPRRRYAVYAPTGEVEVYAAAALDSLLRTDWVTRW